MSVATRAAWDDSARLADDSLLWLAAIITVVSASTTMASTTSVIMSSTRENPLVEECARRTGTERRKGRVIGSFPHVGGVGHAPCAVVSPAHLHHHALEVVQRGGEHIHLVE